MTGRNVIHALNLVAGIIMFFLAGVMTWGIFTLSDKIYPAIMFPIAHLVLWGVVYYVEMNQRSIRIVTNLLLVEFFFVIVSFLYVGKML